MVYSQYGRSLSFLDVRNPEKKVVLESNHLNVICALDFTVNKIYTAKADRSLYVRLNSCCIYSIKGQCVL